MELFHNASSSWKNLRIFGVFYATFGTVWNTWLAHVTNLDWVLSMYSTSPSFQKRQGRQTKNSSHKYIKIYTFIITKFLISIFNYYQNLFIIINNKRTNQPICFNSVALPYTCIIFLLTLSYGLLVSCFIVLLYWMSSIYIGCKINLQKSHSYTKTQEYN
jgi:hypothetical protein